MISCVATPRRRRPTFVSILGELIITVGVLVLGFVGWQVTLADTIMGGQQQGAAEQYASTLANHGEIAEAVELRTDAPPVDTAPASGEAFAVVYIPRFGDFARTVGEGTGRDVLDSLELGLAHYPTSAMPGGVGNMAIAGHRNGQGGPFTHLDELRVGDLIYVRTDSAWYVYEFRNSEYVAPTEVGVVAPVPQAPEATPGDRLLTLTTCNPEWSAAGRLIAYSTFVGWLPASDGMPPALAEHLGAA